MSKNEPREMADFIFTKHRRLMAKLANFDVPTPAQLVMEEMRRLLDAIEDAPDSCFNHVRAGKLSAASHDLERLLLTRQLEESVKERG